MTRMTDTVCTPVRPGSRRTHTRCGSNRYGLAAAGAGSRLAGRAAGPRTDRRAIDLIAGSNPSAAQRATDDDVTTSFRSTSATVVADTGDHFVSPRDDVIR